MITAESVRIGRHQLVCGDGLVIDPPEIAAAYVDPPWGQGMLTRFSTEGPQAPFDEWIGALMDRLAARAPVAYVEMGETWAERTLAAAREAGLALTDRWRTPYGSHTAQLMRLVPGEDDRSATVQSCSVWGGVEVAKWALAREKPGMVWDPCLGLGATALAAEDLGRGCFGVELNRERWSRACEAVAAKAGAMIEPMEG